MISVLMTMFLACGDKEEEDTAAVEEVVDEAVEETEEAEEVSEAEEEGEE
tara:strand:- start:263 stop:412 length:150 start_codon:yes stop_codon:yes gene_type:complete